MQRPRRYRHLKLGSAVLVVVAFMSLFVGSATGVIGSPDDDPSSAPDRAGAAVAVPDGSDSADSADPAGSESTDPSNEPAAVVTDVPPQDVKGAKKLKRTLAWLRRGLADETTFRVGTFNVLGSSHTAKGGNRKGWASGYTRMGWAWSLIAQADLSVVGFQELEEVQYNRMRSLSGWSAYPGPTLDRGSIRNSLAWDPDV
jgi:hypothetical protein